MSENVLNLEQLEEARDWWAEQLGVGDWRLDLMLTRGYEMEGNLARIRMTLPKRHAEIQILVMGDRCGDERDYEEDLVHELLHVVTASWWCRTTEEMSQFEIDTCVEQPIDLLSRLLVRWRRRSFPLAFSWERKMFLRGRRHLRPSFSSDLDPTPEGAD